MEKKDFLRLENLCQFRFMEAGSCFHVCSQENHPVLFHNEEEFKAAMNVVAFAAFLFPDVKIYTFEIMGNHFHFLMSGEKDRIRLFIKSLVYKLTQDLSQILSSSDSSGLSFNYFQIEDLNNFRNVLAYINRNGAVVDSNENVFTYRWGANRFFFNLEARLRYESCRKVPTCRQRRKMFHSDLLAKEEGVHIIGEIEIAYLIKKGPLAAISGTNGKATTTALTMFLPYKRSGVVFPKQPAVFLLHFQEHRDIKRNCKKHWGEHFLYRR